MDKPTPEELRTRWCAAVRSRREELGISQYDLESATGVRKHTISAIERGQYVGTALTCIALAGGLDLDVRGLLRTAEIEAAS